MGGITWRSLGVPRVEALVGAGVFYGAAGSETQAMAGRDVFVVGAGNSAGQAALHLARFAQTVTVVIRRDSLAATMSDYLIRELTANPRITIRPHTTVVDGGGDGRLEWVTLQTDGERTQVPAHALILSEGKLVDSGLLTDVLTAENLSKAFGQSIALEVIDGRYFARRTRSRAAHRRR